MRQNQALTHSTLTPFTRRCIAWMGLAALGNVMLLSVVFVLAQQPFGVDWSATIRTLHTFALPAYSPILLLVTLIMTVLDRRATSEVEAEDTAQANRMVANAVRLALTMVLSFATIMLIGEPTMVVLVLFAVLFGFIAIVRAELFAPARPLSVEVTYRRAAEARRSAEAWVTDALGSTDGTTAMRRAWPVVLLFIAVPVAVPAIAMVLGSWVVWGAEIALDPRFMLMSVAAMAGPTMLVFVWLADADKAEPPRNRAWIRAFLLVLSGVGLVTIASVFLFSGKNTGWMGAIVLGTAAVVAVALWTGWIRSVALARRAVEWKWSAAHLARIEATFDRGEQPGCASRFARRSVSGCSPGSSDRSVRRSASRRASDAQAYRSASQHSPTIGMP